MAALIEDALPFTSGNSSNAFIAKIPTIKAPPAAKQPLINKSKEEKYEHKEPSKINSDRKFK